MGRARSPRYVVVFTREAELDLEAIADFVAMDSPPQARRVTAHIRQSIARLQRWPRRFPPALEAAHLPNDELRQLLVYSFRVIFRINHGVVEVLHIRHAARRPLDPHDLKT